MIKAAVFRSIGQFTPNYFMYAEDADLCYKSWQSGFRNYYIGDISVVHHGSGSSDAKPQNHFATVMMRQSLLEYMRIRRGRLYAVVYQCSIVMIASLRLFLLAVALPFSRNSAKRDLLRRTSTKWFKVLRWALGLETWAKQAA